MESRLESERLNLNVAVVAEVTDSLSELAAVGEVSILTGGTCLLLRSFFASSDRQLAEVEPTRPHLIIVLPYPFDDGSSLVVVAARSSIDNSLLPGMT